MTQEKTKKIKTGEAQVKANGFSLVEILVSMAILSIVAVIVGQLFANTFSDYRQAKMLQKNVEQAQYALNRVTKSLRTSQIVLPTTATDNAQSIRVYDNSQESCIEYDFHDNNSLRVRSDEVDDYNVPSDCDSISGSSWSTIFRTDVLRGGFKVDPPAAGGAGRITIAMQVCATPGCETDLPTTFSIQSSVSLRKYSEIGF